MKTLVRLRRDNFQYGQFCTTTRSTKNQMMNCLRFLTCVRRRPVKRKPFRLLARLALLTVLVLCPGLFAGPASGSEEDIAHWFTLQAMVTTTPAQAGGSWGASYQVTDDRVAASRTYYYKLEDVNFAGNSTLHGPVSARVRAPGGTSLQSNH
jgi:hypothetical protein